MGIYDINGNNLVNDVGYPVINTVAYKNNFMPVVSEDFTAQNSDFTYTSCSVTSSGLSCTGFCKATYGNEITLNDGKACMEFTYSESVVLGVFTSATLAYVDTANKVVGAITGYLQGSSISTSTTSNIDFDFVVGQKYELVLERNFWDITVTIKDIEGSAENTKTANGIVGHSSHIVSNGLKAVGVAVFSGSCIVTGLSYWLPYAKKHIKALIIGDSITEGQMSAKTDATCWARRLLFEHFYSNGLTCGVGGSNPDAGMNRFNVLTALGYTFDYVISYLCTNDSCTDAQIEAKTQAYQGYVNTINATGAKCIWCMLPAYVEGETSTSRANLRTVISSLTGLEALIDFGEVLATSENTHPSLTGQTNMFLLADTVLELAGI